MAYAHRFVMATPLSLEHSCFLKIISDLETFPPESLALLPLFLRHKLACNLPAVDVCQLEQTSFIKGLEMDQVWSHLAEKAIKVYAKGKDGYFSYVCTVLLNHSYDVPQPRFYRTVICKLLFSIKDCLNIVDCNDWSTFEHHLQVNNSVVVPYRHQENYRQFTSSGHSDAQLISFILQNTHCLPKSLDIDCKDFAIDSESWENENWQVLVEYLSAVHKLSLSFVPGFIIFNAMSARGCRQLQLEELSLFGSDINTFLEDTVISVGYYLRRDSGLQCGSCDSLRRLHIISGGPVSDSTAREIADIIENQPSISSICLHLISPTVMATSSGHRRLCSILSRVLQLTQFTEMFIGRLTLLPAGFQQLLYSFLMTPCHHTQTLSISSSLSQDLLGFVDDLSCCHPDDSNLFYKKLHLHNADLPAPITQWLSKHVCLRLETLTLSDIDFASTGMLQFVLFHQRLQVKKLIVYLDDPPDAPEDFQSGCFHGILGSPLLNELHLSCVGALEMENATLLLELISGICKQGQVGMLETLNLEYNELGSLPDAQLILLFEAILSLPQLERLTLDLSENSLNERQLKLLYRLWQEKCGGRKLKELFFKTSHHAPILDTSIQEIALKLDL